jgi:hypothetical protein
LELAHDSPDTLAAHADICQDRVNYSESESDPQIAGRNPEAVSEGKEAESACSVLEESQAHKKGLLRIEPVQEACFVVRSLKEAMEISGHFPISVKENERGSELGTKQDGQPRPQSGPLCAPKQNGN